MAEEENKETPEGLLKSAFVFYVKAVGGGIGLIAAVKLIEFGAGAIVSFAAA